VGDPSVLDAKFTRLKHLPSEAADRFFEMGLIGNEVGLEEYFRYRYLVDADGYHCAWSSLFQKLLSGSAVLKMESAAEQWYHSLLQPWLNYVPLEREAGDAPELHKWLLSHDAEVREIAERGVALAQSISLERGVDEVIATLRAIVLPK
jgi:hypothetical protein